MKNSQWTVSNIGIESIKPAPEYQIEVPRLTNVTVRGKDTFYDWPVHLAEKSWVNIEEFIDAYSAALTSHAGKYLPVVDQARLDATLIEARRISAVTKHNTNIGKTA